MKRPLIGNKTGLTMVELLVAITILSLIIGLTMTLFFNIQRTQKNLDTKFTANLEIDRITKRMENSLRSARCLVSGTEKGIQFIDSNGDTNAYYVLGDTLFNNDEIFTNLPVDSCLLIYVKVQADEKIADFYLFDMDMSGTLDTTELKGISGLNIYLDFLTSRLASFKKIRIKKEFFIVFRNLQ